MDIRRATEDDIIGIASARLSNGPAHDDSGADAGYCRHLLTDGHLFVAVDAGTVLGFGGAVDVGDARLLSDLYVHADAHGRGVGKGLLAAVMDGAAERFTFASLDPGALPLYARVGMRSWWPLLTLRGSRASLAGTDECIAADVDVEEAARDERRATGLERSATYRYWAGRTWSRTVAVERDGRRIAIGAVRTNGSSARVEHLVASDADVTDALAAIARLLHVEQLRAYIPGNRVATVELLRAGFVVEDVSVHMATSADLVHPALQVVHPGLC